MEHFSKQVQIRWSDLDPNFHVLHSKYYDFGAFCRMSLMVEAGITPELMTAHHIGPILLREECVFRREIRFGEDIRINLMVTDYKPDFSRFTIRHEIFKPGDVLSATILADIAWLDTARRKMTHPPVEIVNMLETFPRSGMTGNGKG